MSCSPFFRTLSPLGIRCYNPLAPGPKAKACGMAAEHMSMQQPRITYNTCSYHISLSRSVALGGLLSLTGEQVLL